jgi:hypothetical protein
MFFLSNGTFSCLFENRRIAGWWVNNELEIFWKEAVVAQFKVLFWDFLLGLGKTTENLQRAKYW